MEPLDQRYVVRPDAPASDGSRRWRVLHVPIFAEHEVGGVAFNAAWCRSAVLRARERKAAGYLARLHVHHHGDVAAPSGAGFLDSLEIGEIELDGAVLTAIYSDLIVDDVTLSALKRAELPYISVEINDPSKPEISSAALLPTEAPFFKFPLITVQASAAAARQPLRLPAMRWRQTMPDDMTTAPAAPAAPAAPPGDDKLQLILDAIATLSQQIAALVGTSATERQAPATAPAEAAKRHEVDSEHTAMVAALSAEVTALKTQAAEVKRREDVRGQIKRMTEAGLAFDPSAEEARMLALAKEGLAPGKYAEMALERWARSPEAPKPAPEKSVTATMPEGEERWKREYAEGSGPAAKLNRAIVREEMYLADRRYRTKQAAQRGRSMVGVLLVLAVICAGALFGWCVLTPPLPEAEAALSADAPIEISGPVRFWNYYGMSGSVHIYAGSALGMEADGYVRPLTAGDRFVGHAYQEVDSTDYSTDGTLSCKAYGGLYRAEVSLAAAVTDVGKSVYMTDDATYVIDPANGSSSFVGKLIRYVSSTKCIVEFDTGTKLADGMIYALDAAGTALTNTVTETVLASFDIPASSLQVGDVIEVRAACIATSTSDTDTLTLKLYADTEELAASDATNVTNNDIGQFHAFITVRAVGSSGQIVAAGTYTKTLAAEGTAALLPFYTAASTEATNATFTISVKGTWSVADADNSCRADTFAVWIHRAR